VSDRLEVVSRRGGLGVPSALADVSRRRAAGWGRALAGLALASFIAAACGSVDELGGGDATSHDTSEQDVTDTSEAGDDATDPVDDAADTTLGDTDAPPDTSASPDAADATDTASPPDTTEPEVDRGFPGHDLVIQIVDPSGRGTAPVIGSVTRVAGVLFGEADTIIWQSGQQSGAITPGAFWHSGPILLSAGDNRITVTAIKGEVSTSDAITVTYNPAYRFDDTLVARPRSLWVNTATQVVFTIPSSLYSNANLNTVRLLRVDANGNTLETIGVMRDDGALNTSGDEIGGDGVFTIRRNITCTSPEPRYYRASVEIQGSSSYLALSPTIRVDCVERLTTASCNAHKAVVDAASALLIDQGSPIDEVVAYLQAQDGVSAAGRASSGGHSAWIQFTDGTLGAVLATPSGKRGAGGEGAAQGFEHLASVATHTIEVGSKRAIVLSPFASKFGATDDGVEVASAISGTVCPAYELESGAPLLNASASLNRFRLLHTYGVASIATHGEVLFDGLDPEDIADRYGWSHRGGQEVIWTGSAVECGQLLQTQPSCTVQSGNLTGNCPAGSRCLVTQGTASETEASGTGICYDETQLDLRLGRVVMTNRGYAVTPSFFKAYRGRGFPNSLVNLGACRSMYNGTLASALYAAGARAITGFSDYVESAWAREKVLELFEDFGAEGTVGTRFRAAQDPDNAGSWWRLFGATNLDLSNAELINGSFETGDTVGWTATGDGRVVTQLGAASTVDGKFMGLISTGLGYTVETGTLEQTFCIPADKFLIEFYWKFFSEEFKEFCGSQYQDTFEAVLVGSGGQLTLVDVKIDDLCGYQDGTCGSCPNPNPCDLACMGQSGCHLPEEGGACVGSYNCNCGRYFVGLIPSDVSFDQGGVYEILWQRAVRNVQALAGTGPVTLRLFATDIGDSVFDTAILIDAIQFK